MFNIHVTHVQVADEQGNVKLMHHDPVTRELRQTGVIEKVDPLELEKQLLAKLDQSPEYSVEVNEDELPETVFTVREGSEAVVRGFLAEADVVGKSLKMGNMEIGEARQAFGERSFSLFFFFPPFAFCYY